MLLLDVVHLVSSFSPKVVRESALGAFSVSEIVCLSWTCSSCMSMVSRSHAPIVCIYWEFRVLQKGERFNVLLLDRVLDMDRVGRWKALDPLKSAILAVYPVFGAILMKCLSAHTPRGDVKRGFDLELKTMVDDASLSCVRGLQRLKHVEPLSQLLFRWLACRRTSLRPSLVPCSSLQDKWEVWTGYVFFGRR